MVGSLPRPVGGAMQTDLPAWLMYGLPTTVSVSSWLLGSWYLARKYRSSFLKLLTEFGIKGWRWMCLALAMGLLVLLPLGDGFLQFHAAIIPLTLPLPLGMVIAEYIRLRQSKAIAPTMTDSDENSVNAANPQIWANWPRRLTIIFACLYVIIFTAMNWGLYFNLQIPHGDSGMYEEHLWNVEHGKGFRSNLDPGPFLGEHLQVIHLLLIPIHWLFPSMLTMDLCESIALALAVIPIFSIVRRHTSSEWAAMLICVAYLLYFPVQYLDIEIDFKTFRPITFGVPFLLWTIDRMEQRRFISMTVFAVLTLMCKEDYAIPLSLLGFWLMLFPQQTQSKAVASHHQSTNNLARIVGLSLWLGAAAYLLFAVIYAIPWFRDGHQAHYTSYLQDFGHSPGEIITGMIANPVLVWEKIANPKTFTYFVCLIAPLGFLPLASPSRLLMALPLFVLLMLSPFGKDVAGLFHHVHAPLVPLVVWSAAAGLGNLTRPRTVEVQNSRRYTAESLATFALLASLLTGVSFTLSPLGVKFWDTNHFLGVRRSYWRDLYLPDERARQFEKVDAMIPRTARVAATEFVLTRLTHCEEAYDYGRFRRAIVNYEDRIPDDTEYIVLDLRHPYSQDFLSDTAAKGDFREVLREPEMGFRLPDTTDGYFVVLKRREQ